VSSGETWARESRLTLDRRENGVCVLLDDRGIPWEFPEWFAPRNARDGDVLLIRSSASESGTRHAVTFDGEATSAARAAAAEVLARLRAAGPGSPSDEEPA
jgi:hypothetical protein